MQYPLPYSIRAISEAIEKGQIPTLEHLFSEMPDTKRVVPALCRSVGSGVPVKVQTIEFVIKDFHRLGIDINSDGGALLRTCIEAENIALVDLCLKYGATPRILADRDGVPRSPLKTAVSLGWDDDRRTRPRKLAADARPAAIIDLLLEKGADLSEKGIICRAASHRSPGVLKNLIERGGDVNDRDESGNTPLFFCADSLPVARCLISMGAGINVRNVEGRTPLMNVVSSFRVDVRVIRLLIKSGAELDAQDRFGRTALMRAARKIAIEELVKLTL